MTRNNCTRIENGISPVIGVVLLLAIVIAIAGVFGFFLLDFNEGNTIEQAGVQIDETGNDITVRLSQKGNVDSVRVNVDGSELEKLDDTGQSTTLKLPEGTQINIIGVADGNETVIRSYETKGQTGDSVMVSDPGSTTQKTGTVEINPPIQGAEVKSMTSTGNVFSTTTTDSNGEYSIETDSDGFVTVVVNDFDDSALSHSLYASARQPVSNSGKINFEFTSEKTATVDGETILVSNQTTQQSDTTNQIGTVQQLQAVATDLDGSYELVRDIDASETSSWNSGNGFEPIGNSNTDNPFTGEIDGNGYTISGLTVDTPSRHAGIIEHTKNSLFKDFTLKEVDVTNGSSYNTGGLAGNAEGGTVFRDIDVSGTVNSTGTSAGLLVGGLRETTAGPAGTTTIDTVTASGSVTGSGSVGGIVGSAYGYPPTDARIDIRNSSSAVKVTGDSRVGGLAGDINDTYLKNSSATETVNVGSSSSYDNVGGGLVGKTSTSNNSIIENSYATGDVVGKTNTSSLGGLVGGYNGGDEITNSYATGDVTGSGNLGGLIGDDLSSGSVLRNSYATGNVTTKSSGDNIGGLIGDLTGIEIKNSYATGNVTGGDNVGGLIGNYSFSGNTVSSGDISLSNSYATGYIEASGSNVGAIIGRAGSGVQQTISSVYWPELATGQSIALGSNGRGHTLTDVNKIPTSDMVGSNAASNMSGFDFSTNWSTSDKFPTIQKLDSEKQVQNMQAPSKLRISVDPINRVVAGNDITVSFSASSPVKDKTAEFKLLIDGEQKDSKTRNISAGQSITESFTHTTSSDSGGSIQVKLVTSEVTDSSSTVKYRERIQSSSRANLSQNVPVVKKLSYGDELSGSLTDADPSGFTGEYDAYTFDGSSGETVTITMSGSNADTKLLLLDSSGDQITVNDDASDVSDLPYTYNSRIKDYTLPKDDEYIIIGTSYSSSNRFDYTLKLEDSSG
jgi:flagellin-like protein